MADAASIEIIESRLFYGIVADELVQSIVDAVDERGRCAIALAGGRTPAGIYRLLTRPPRFEQIEWDKVDLFWSDERWVPHDSDYSNYRMAKETMLSQIPSPGPEIYAVDTSLETPEEAAEQYTQLIKEKLPQSEAGTPVFDVVLLGMGADGHTASLFPGQPHDSAAVCFAVDHPDGASRRVTLSPETLFGAKRVVFIVKGDNKASALKRVLESDEPTADLPARLYTRAPERVTWFVDSAAAKSLVRRA